MSMLDIDFEKIEKRIKETNFNYMEGTVRKVIGLTVEVEGIKAFVGEVCIIYNEKIKQFLVK